MAKHKKLSHADSLLKWLWIPVLILFVTLSALGFRVFYLISAPADSKNKTEVMISIAPSSTTEQIGHYLKGKGLIRSPYLFKKYCKYTKSDRLLQAGLFKVNAAMTMKDIVNVLEGKTNSRCFVKVTIPEGSSLRTMDIILSNAGLCSPNAFLEYASKAQPEFIPSHDILRKDTTYSLEGYLFPETYLFDKGVSLHTMANTMLVEFEKRIRRFLFSAYR